MLPLLEELGFTHWFDIAGRYSIADLLPPSRPRCGIYVLEFPNQTFYIGQAIQAVRRYSEHRAMHSTILGFGFQPVASADLDVVEERLIKAAERAGMRLTNVVHAAAVQGETDLDGMISPFDQDQWCENPHMGSGLGPRVVIAGHATHRLRYQRQFAEFQQHPYADQVVAILRTMLGACVLAPAQTEYAFWSVSCLPSTNKHTNPRLVCLNVGPMETLVIGYDPQDPSVIWSFLNMAKSVFEAAYPAARRFQRTYPATFITVPQYRSAGFDQLQIQMEDLETLAQVLNNRVIQKAVRTLTLRLMRKSPTLFGRYHCFALADAMLAETNSHV